MALTVGTLGFADTSSGVFQNYRLGGVAGKAVSVRAPAHVIRSAAARR